MKGQRTLDSFFAVSSASSTTTTTTTTTVPTTTITSACTPISHASTSTASAAQSLQPSSFVPVGPGQKLKKRRSMMEGVNFVEPVDNLNETRLFSRAHLNTIVDKVRCKDCLVGEFEYKFLGAGAGGYTVWVCMECGVKFDTKYSRVLGAGQYVSYPNFATTYVAIRNDTGYQGLSRLLSGLHLKPCVESVFYDWSKCVYARHHTHYEELQRHILDKVKEDYRYYYHVEADEEGLTSVMVSFDATYTMRGHYSRYATAYIVDGPTGVCLLHMVLAKCSTCHFSGNRVKANCPDRSENFHGHSGDMEGPLVELCFEKGRDLGFKFETLICDGDAKAYPFVKDYYGFESVTKELCGNHVGKLLSCDLFNLRDSTYTIQKQLVAKILVRIEGAGHTKGRLDLMIRRSKSLVLITKLSSRHFLSMPQKQRHIMGILKHHSDFPLNDDLDIHDDCYTPESGKGCPFKMAKESNQSLPARKRGTFTKWLNTPAYAPLENIFKRLSSDSLLEMCERGLTQNINESMHSKQHMMAAKHKDQKEDRLDFVCELTVLQHNFGHENACMLNSVGYGTSEVLLSELRKEDKNSERSAASPPGKDRSSKAQRDIGKILRQNIAQANFLSELYLSSFIFFFCSFHFPCA
ncbi:unnamed protein product [Meganyctiphanes norvegica]|uniref:Mutator-like transposase domain-containing protein n=1 Tax=Meganyctiphanes norvegica TaxID=48144 RepID=A0AAV2SXV9_MEGNR